MLAAAPESAGRVGYQFALGEIDLAEAKNDEAVKVFKHVLLTWPLAFEAQQSRARLTALGMESSLTPEELRSLGDAYYKAGRYADASEQYHALERISSGTPAQRNAFAIAAAACDLKLKRLTQAQAEALAATNDENGARRLYLLMELARNRDDLTAQTSYVDMLRDELSAESVVCGGSFLQRKYVPAAQGLSASRDVLQRAGIELSAEYECGGGTLARWVVVGTGKGNMTRRERYLRNRYGSIRGRRRTVSALYWRAKLYEQQDHEPGLAAGRITVR